jgi:hypothetical protein
VNPGYSRLLLAGGCEILHDRPPFTRAAEATHALIDRKSELASLVDLPALAALGVKLLHPNFVADYLIEGPTVSFDRHVLAPSTQPPSGASAAGSKTRTPRKRPSDSDLPPAKKN